MNLFWAGCSLTILVFFGIPFLVFFLGLLFSGGMGTVIALGGLLLAVIIGVAVSNSA